MNQTVEPRTNRMLRLLRRHPLAGYFLLTFTLSWTWMIIALGLLKLPMLGVAGALAPFLGPTASAFAMTAAIRGWQGVTDLLRSYVRWRVAPTWYLIAVLGWPAVMLFGTFVQPGASAAFQAPTIGFGLSFVGIFAFIFVTGGPLGEEGGWRGFALPYAQQRLGPVAGSLLVGAMHGLWHLPVYLLVPGYNGAPPDLPGTLASFGVFAGTVAVGSITITWIFNSTRQSLLPVMLLHAANNAAGALPVHLFPGFHPNLEPLRLAVTVLASILIVLLTRGRLGYDRPARREAAG